MLGQIHPNLKLPNGERHAAMPEGLKTASRGFRQLVDPREALLPSPFALAAPCKNTCAKKFTASPDCTLRMLAPTGKPDALTVDDEFDEARLLRERITLPDRRRHDDVVAIRGTLVPQ